MKKVLKILALVLTLAMVFSLAACGNQDNATSGSNSESAGIAKDKLKIGVIHIGDPADGSGYSYAHDQGIVGMQKNLGLSDDQIVRKLNVSDSDNSAIKEAIESCVAEGCNLIFGTSYGYMDTMEEMAAEHPEVYFSHGTGYLSNDTNFNNYFGRIYQARYLAGVAAGLKTETNKIGYVAAYGTETGGDLQRHQRLCAGRTVGQPRRCRLCQDPPAAGLTRRTRRPMPRLCCRWAAMLSSQHCDTANPQIAAEKAGKWGCGYNSDMTEQAPNAHLTATIWHWDVYYTAAAKAVIDGTWKEFGNYYGGYADGLVGISPLSKNCAEGTADYLAQVEALYNANSWDVFSGVKLSFDENGKLVQTDAPLMDNAGNEIVAAGGPSIEDSVITGTMDYFVAGVELK